MLSGQKKNPASSKEETEELLLEFENIGECPVLGQKSIPYFGVYGKLH
jgi:hypothetical protein